MDGLAEFVAATADEHGVPGVAVGVWAAGRETYACHGVTSVDNPLPVDRDTLFVLGSVTKTFTATAVMCLVAEGRIDLDAPVRQYVPELVLADEEAASAVTVLQLLNHTAGFDWRSSAETGEGDDALAAYVAQLAGSPLLALPGSRTSYSQIGYNLAGRVVEKVTGLTYERAVAALLLEPLGLGTSTFAPGEAMTRRFAVGHNLATDGALTVARQWKDTRANNPGGGLASTAAEMIRWARFHLGDGGQVLPTGLLRRMREPTAALPGGSTLGDALGIGWFLRDVDGVRTIGHGGSANGQFAELAAVPELDVAVVTLANAGPDAGLAFNRAAVGWVLEHAAGIVEHEAQPMPFDAAAAAEITGQYENEMMRITIAADGAGLTIECAIKHKIRAATATELPPDLPPAGLGLLPGAPTGYVVTSGGLRGHRGSFARDEHGAVVGMEMAGRSFAKNEPSGQHPG